MAIAVAQVNGSTAFGSGAVSVTFGSSTTTGSAIVIVGCISNTNSVGPVAGDVSDSKSNTWQVGIGAPFGTTGNCSIGGYYNNAGTRGASHQMTFDVTAPTAGTVQAAIIEITGQNATSATSCYDAAVDATANDIVTPFDVTAATAVTSGSIGIYGASISGDSGNPAWTDPTGYTVIGSQNDAGSSFVYYAGYKLSESGTPTVGAGWSGTHSQSPRELFMAFLPAASSASANAVFANVDVTATNPVVTGDLPPPGFLRGVTRSGMRPG